MASASICKITTSVAARQGPVPSGSSVVTSSDIIPDEFSDAEGKYNAEGEVALGVKLPVPFDQVKEDAAPVITASN